ncbi:hypothetical protein CDAR_205881 [Caerostris darwini]|uniref:Uncharacterized protein n=1 Tax=Caerostris darwini TaxID=1538125 RepID=A0AAV4W8W9_9ARAC|nr:hypothetical protein CDAR_205881 [Caerostris darwini]
MPFLKSKLYLAGFLLKRVKIAARCYLFSASIIWVIAPLRPTCHSYYFTIDSNFFIENSHTAIQYILDGDFLGISILGMYIFPISEEASNVPGKEKGTTVLTRSNRKKKEANYTQKAIIPKILMISEGSIVSGKEKGTIARFNRKNGQPEPTGKKGSKLYPEDYYSDDSNGRSNGLPVVSFQVETHKNG